MRFPKVTALSFNLKIAPHLATHIVPQISALQPLSEPPFTISYGRGPSHERRGVLLQGRRLLGVLGTVTAFTHFPDLLSE